MKAEEAGVGYNVGEPIAPSADSYDEDYPSNFMELIDHEYRDVVHEVFEAVDGRSRWVDKELDMTDASHFSKKYGRDYSKGEYTIELTPKANAAGWLGRSNWHVGQWGASPLGNENFMKATDRFGYSPRMVADMFDDLTEDEVRDRFIELDIYTDNTLYLEDHEIDLDQYADEPWTDARLLERLDDEGYSLDAVANGLDVGKGVVEEHARKYKMLDVQQ